MEEEQAKYLEEAFKVVKNQAFHMKRAMDTDNLKLALDHATEMLRELRTGLLTPKNYYELYMKIMDEMREFEEYLQTLQRSGRSMVEIYERVQCCAAIVPRLYLLCCVGGVYITSKEAPAKDILKDLIEMIKGVQHPMRGLFLRHYLTQVSKNRLPDVGSPFEGIGGNVHDAISFLLQNFTEANRLWVRLQHQGAARDRKRREKERMDLRILVGTNLVRLSQLEGLDMQEYKNSILPKVVEEILACKDTIAQSYLMECIIQVFPDDFHLGTLEVFLQTCTSLKEKVNVRTILELMMDRLANHFAATGQNMPADIPAFKLFNDCITTLIEERTTMSLVETLRLQTALTNFALKCYPGKMDYVNHCLTAAGALIAKTDFAATAGAASEDARQDETTQQIETLLSSPLSSLSLLVLEMPSYSKLMSYLPWSNWKQVASVLLRSVISLNSPLTEVAQVEQLFAMITPLVRDQHVASSSSASNNDEDNHKVASSASDSPAFKEEQHLVARIPHLLRAEDTDVVLAMLVVTRTQFTAGGMQRIGYTYPPLMFAALSLAKRVFQREQQVILQAEGQEVSTPVTPPQYSSKKVFHILMDGLNHVATNGHPEVAMRLFLQAAQSADHCRFSAIAYEFVKEALLLYECEVTDSRQQVIALHSFIGTLLNMHYLTVEDYEALITKIAQYSNKLLKKVDQSKLVALSSLLFFPPQKPVASNTIEVVGPAAQVALLAYSDPDRVLECMQRALKVARNANPNLFVEMLDRYLYYFENDNPVIQVQYIVGLISLINETFAADRSAVLPATEAHYRNTLGYIRSRQQQAETAEKFAPIQW
jgi:vacuolar protein sorting-associated protein 35